jgi:hypothetical protein
MSTALLRRPSFRAAIAALAIAASTACGGSRDDDEQPREAEPTTHAPPPDTSRGGLPGTVSAAAWTPLKPGGSGTLRLSADGVLSAGPRTFQPHLPMKDAAGGVISYHVSPPSPGAKYAFVNGTAPEGTAYVYVADLRHARLVPTQVLKYGPAPWVAYAASQPYALLASKQEGTTTLFTIDLTDGSSHPIDATAVRTRYKSRSPDPASLAWNDGQTFTLTVHAECVPSLSDCRRDDRKPFDKQVQVTLPDTVARLVP